MAENTELEAFLQESTSAPVSVPPEPERAASTGESSPPSPAPAPVQDDDGGDDASPASAEEGSQAVPREALEAERRRRQDWKQKAAEREGENAELRRQLEALQQRAAPQPQPQQQQPVYRAPMPDPASDPQAWAMHVMQEQTKAFVNHTLNVSERDLRREIGAEKVTEYVNEFRQLSQADPSLVDKLYSNADPYDWMRREVERQRMLRDIGDDPSQYRSKIEAEARAKWEAERGGATTAAEPVPSRVAGMAPSLANARSSAPRSVPAYTGMSLEQMFPPYAERKKAKA
jgi:hypothetical protein